MKFAYRYFGQSKVESSANQTDLSFVPDALRAPVHFMAEVNQHLPFREAISALHDVVIADQRYQAPDKSAYQAWLQREEASMLAEFMADKSALEAKIKPLRAELDALRKEKSLKLLPFRVAQGSYFNYLYQAHRDAWFVLDPVITVHPDRVFFECFSRDESSYAQLACSHNIFKQLGEFSCGTTNIDYSEGLYREFQKIRDYKITKLAVESAGFLVQTADDPGFVEQKIDVPDSWVRGFLQVSSAMNLPAHRFDLHPMDVHNFCHVLRRRKERVGPRSIRFVLEPGQPVKAIFEPWQTEVICRRSPYLGHTKAEIRVWGRRRLLMLERLIPVAHSFTVHLMGTGLPNFWVANMPDMQFTLGLSGWTANDWSRAGQFDLMAPRGEVNDADKLAVFAALGKRWSATSSQLAQDCGLSTAVVESALTQFTQAGRVIYDMGQSVYLLRELAREPLPMASLRFASDEEGKADRLLLLNALEAPSTEILADGSQRLASKAKDGTRQYRVWIRLDNDQRLVEAGCECSYFIRNKLQRGPCEHMLALRLAQAGTSRVSI